MKGRVLSGLCLAWAVLAGEPSGTPCAVNLPPVKRYEPPPWMEKVEYLIVTSEGLKPHVEPLLEWKRQKGLAADLVTVEEVLSMAAYRDGVDDADRLRSFLKELRERWGLIWVCLVGDVNVVPARYLFRDESKRQNKYASDFYYACLDGRWNENGDGLFANSGSVKSGSDKVDVTADLFVSRIPAETPEEMHNYLAKYFLYVRPKHTDYQHKLLFMSGAVHPSDGQPLKDGRYDGERYYDGVIATHFKDLAGVEVSTCYQSAGTFTEGEVLKRWSEGAGLIGHYQHSYIYNMGMGKNQGSINTSSCQRLMNLERPCVVYSGGCNVNQIDQESVSEALLFAPAGGAVAFIGSTETSYGGHGFEQEFYRLVFREGVTRIGEAHLRSKKEAWARGFMGYAVNLIGEPEMEIWTGRPLPLEVEADIPNEISTDSPAPLKVKVTSKGVPVEGALVCLRQAPSLQVAGRTQYGGFASLDTGLAGGGEAVLTCLASGHLPFQKRLKVKPGGAQVRIEEILAASPSWPDGGTRALPAGEEVRIRARLANAGKAGSGKLKVSAEILSEGAELVRKSEAVVEVPAGKTMETPELCALCVPEAAPADHPVRILVKVQGADGKSDKREWKKEILFRTSRPRPELFSYRIVPGPADGAGQVEVQIGNLGEAQAAGVRVVARSTPTVQAGAVERVGDRAFRFPFRRTLSEGEGEAGIALEGPAGPVLERTLKIDRPAAPAVEVGASPGISGIELYWTPPASQRAGGYALMRSAKAGGPYEKVNDFPIPMSYYVDQGLKSLTPYYYVWAWADPDGRLGEYSKEYSFSTTIPFQRDWPKKAKGVVDHVLLQDLDGDGRPEIMTGDDASGVWIWHADGREFRHGGDDWTFGLFQEVPGGAFPPAAGDLDGDGKPEIVAAGKGDCRKVFAWHLNGKPVPGWPQDTASRNMSSPRVADFDGDGKNDVLLVSGFGGNIFLWKGNGTPLVGKNAAVTALDSFNYSNPLALDLDGDKNLEIVFNSGGGSLQVLHHDGKMFAGFPYKSGGPGRSSVAIGDVDKDKKPDFVFGTKGNSELVCVGLDGKPLPGWPVQLDAARNAGEADCSRGFPALADIDGDGKLEIFFSAHGRKLRGLRCDGTGLPGWPRDLPECGVGVAAADLDGDGAPEILVTCLDSCVYAFHHDGSPVAGWPVRTTGRVETVPCVWDLDGDGDVEVLVGASDALYAWDLPAPLRPEGMCWPMLDNRIDRPGLYGARKLTPREKANAAKAQAAIEKQERQRQKEEKLAAIWQEATALRRQEKWTQAARLFEEVEIQGGGAWRRRAADEVQSIRREPGFQWERALSLEAAGQFKAARWIYLTLASTGPGQWKERARASLARLPADEPEEQGR